MLRFEIGLDKDTRELAARILSVVERVGAKLMPLIDDIEAEVKAETDEETAIEKLVNGLVAQVEAADPNNPRLVAVLASMKANSARYAALALANTPSSSGTPVIPPAVTA